MPKRSIRSHFLAERKACPIETCAVASLEIQRRFLRSNLFRDAHCLALYSAIHNEVLTDEVARQALEIGKVVSYPRISNDDLEFVTIESLEDLVPGAFGVLEPKGHSLVSSETLDLVVVPGVAFDHVGHRLGYGRGFYDRALSGCRRHCEKVGFAYEFQLVEKLPAAEHDETLSVLITESRMLTMVS